MMLSLKHGLGSQIKLNYHIGLEAPSDSVFPHRIRMYAIYGNIYPQYTPVLLASIYHTWIRHG